MGHVISDGGIAVQSDKVKDVLNWKQPENVPEIRSFLGLAGYYRRFIEGFSKIVKPLTSLLEKGRDSNVGGPVVFTQGKQQANIKYLRNLPFGVPFSIFKETMQFTIFHTYIFV